MASNPYEVSTPAGPVAPRKASRLVIAAAILGVVILVVPLGLCLGLLALISAEGRAAHEQYLREKAAIAPVLTSDPAFQDIEESEYSGGGAYLTGQVDRQDEIEKLRERLAPRLGKDRADEIVQDVYTREAERMRE